MSNRVNHNTRNRTVILSEVEGSRREINGYATAFLDCARNDVTV